MTLVILAGILEVYLGWIMDKDITKIHKKCEYCGTSIFCRQDALADTEVAVLRH